MYWILRTIAASWLLPTLLGSLGAGQTKEKHAFIATEMAINQLGALFADPRMEQAKAAKKEILERLKATQAQKPQIDKLQAKIKSLRAKLELAETKFAERNAEFESKLSLLDLEIQANGQDSPQAKNLKKQVAAAKTILDAAKAECDNIADQIKPLAKELEEFESPTLKKLRALSHGRQAM